MDPTPTNALLVAADRYAERQARRRGRLVRSLWPDGDDSTSVGDALRRAAAGPGSEAGGRDRNWR